MAREKGSGVRPDCKKCNHETRRIWRLNNLDKMREWDRNYRLTHREQRKATYIKMRDSGYFSKYQRRWRQLHRKEHNALNQKWRHNHPEYVRAQTLNHAKVTPEEYEQFYLKQNGCCAICGVHEEILRVDHDHITGKVRGLLCNPCNLAIGIFKDSPMLCQKAKEYLERLPLLILRG